MRARPHGSLRSLQKTEGQSKSLVSVTAFYNVQMCLQVIVRWRDTFMQRMSN
jgi:hypothetical protein